MDELYQWYITWHICSKAFTLLLPTLMTIVSRGTHTICTKSFFVLFFKWCEIGAAQSQSTELLAQVLLAGGLRHQMSNACGIVLKKRCSLIYFHLPLLRLNGLIFKGAKPPRLPLTSAGMTTVPHFWGQGVTSPSYKTNFRHLTTQTLSLVSLQMKISGHNSLVSSFLSHNWCKINLGINHPIFTVRETIINLHWIFVPSSMQFQESKLTFC